MRWSELLGDLAGAISLFIILFVGLGAAHVLGY